MSSFGYDLLGFGANASGSGGDTVDDEFNRVSFLAHMEGANNGVNNAIDDGSASNHTITAVGKATQGSFGPFARPDGEWGVSFDGSGDRVRANWTDVLESVAFTIEAWVFIPSAMDQYDCIAWLQEATHGSDGDNGFFIRANNSNTIEFAVLSGSTKYNTISSAISFGEWHHLSLSKSGTTMYSSVDGTVTSRSAPSSINNSKYLNIGAADASGSVSYPFNGLISNVRFLKGTALYTSNFTVPTSPLTAITNTKFLGCQSNRFVDNSSNDYTITPSGNAAVSAFGPFLTDEVYDPAVNAASLFIPQQGSYLSFSTGGTPLQTPSTFTAEGWFYLTQAPASGLATGIISCGNAGDSNGSNSWMLGVQDDLKPRIVSSGYVALTAAGTPVNLNEWCHVAMTYDGSTWSLYQNGVRSNRSTTQLISGTNHNQGYIGRDYYDTSRFAAKAYYSDVRMVTSLLYTGTTYTVPTAPLTAITNTQLLLNMADAQAIDSAAQDVLNFEGGAKISTGQAKFGDTSLYLSNSGNPKPLVEIYNSESRAFGTGDFTVETWIYIDGTPSQYAYIFDMRHGSSSPIDATEYTWALSFNYMGQTSDQLQWASNNTSPNAILSADYPPISEWVHIAVCRSGTTTRMFYNGTQSAINNSDSSDMRDTGQYGTIGARFSDEYHIDAYFDDIRFSKMARYTNNFTAPSAPFPDKGQ